MVFYTFAIFFFHPSFFMKEMFYCHSRSQEMQISVTMDLYCERNEKIFS